jgi:hypothetical protein
VTGPCPGYRTGLSRSGGPSPSPSQGRRPRGGPSGLFGIPEGGVRSRPHGAGASLGARGTPPRKARASSRPSGGTGPDRLVKWRDMKAASLSETTSSFTGTFQVSSKTFRASTATFRASPRLARSAGPRPGPDGPGSSVPAPGISGPFPCLPSRLPDRNMPFVRRSRFLPYVRVRKHISRHVPARAAGLPVPFAAPAPRPLPAMPGSASGFPGRPGTCPPRSQPRTDTKG